MTPRRRMKRASIVCVFLATGVCAFETLLRGPGPRGSVVYRRYLSFPLSFPFLACSIARESAIIFLHTRALARAVTMDP